MLRFKIFEGVKMEISIIPWQKKAICRQKSKIGGGG